jgi:hypothetical protein
MQDLPQSFDATSRGILPQIFPKTRVSWPPAYRGRDGRRVPRAAFGQDRISLAAVIFRRYVHLHINGFDVQPCKGLLIILVQKISPQDLRRTSQPREIQPPSIPQVLMGINDELIRRTWAEERAGWQLGCRSGGTDAEEVSAIHGFKERQY